MKTPFVKMHGNGNDFVIIDNIKQNFNKDITIMTGSAGSAHLDYQEINYPILFREDAKFQEQSKLGI